MPISSESSWSLMACAYNTVRSRRRIAYLTASGKPDQADIIVAKLSRSGTDSLGRRITRSDLSERSSGVFVRCKTPENRVQLLKPEWLAALALPAVVQRGLVAKLLRLWVAADAGDA